MWSDGILEGFDRAIDAIDKENVMGSCYEEQVIEAENVDELKDRFNEICQKEAYLHGHAGYSGTFAEKRHYGMVVIEEEPIGREEAEDHALDSALKWQPAQAYNLGDGRWYVGGWCSL